MKAWKPTQGYLSGRGRYTIRKPTFRLKAGGVVVGVIQMIGSDIGIMQMGEDKPQSIGSPSCFYHLTNYGKGWKAGDQTEARLQDFRGAAFYMLGPDHRDLIAAIDEVEKVAE